MLGEKFDALTDSNKNLDEALERKTIQENSLTTKNDAIQKQTLATESELAQKTERLSNTNIAIANGEDKLKNLVSNINVFSEEFSGFVDQGTKQVKVYLVLAIIPLVLLCIVVFQLFHGAVDLSLKYSEIPKIDLLTLFTTRVPFVTIAAFVVAACIKILYFLTSRIINIHQQRLNMAKIAILAKDVSDASTSNLDLSSDEIYEAKTYLKMSILKSYLADQIGDYSYKVRDKKNIGIKNTPAETVVSPAPAMLHSVTE